MELVFKNHATVLYGQNILQQSHKIIFPIDLNAFFKKKLIVKNILEILMIEESTQSLDW